MQLSNDGLAALMDALPKLTELGLNGTQVTNAGLAALARLSELRSISLQWCRGITNAGMVASILHVFRGTQAWSFPHYR